MTRPSTTASIAAFHTGVFDTIGFLTAWSFRLRQSLLRTCFVDPFGLHSLLGRKNSLKALLPRAPETVPPQSAVPSRFVLEFVWRGLRLDEDIGSGSEVNRLVSELVGQGLPSVDFAHGDLTGGQQ